MVTRIIVSLVLAPLFLGVLFFLPQICLAVLVSGILGMAAFELMRATCVPRHKGLYTATIAAAVAIPLLHWLGCEGWGIRAVILVLLAAIFLPALGQYGKEGELKFEQLLICLFGGAVIPVLLSALVQLKGMEHGKFLVMLPVVSAFTTDIGAYFVGMFFGKHRGVTKVSPNKSLEGFAGGILSGCLFMLGYGLILSRFAGLEVSMPVMALYGILGSAVTEVGDLAFSLIKRQFGVKDYGHLLPGHGGMLDRFDSMIFAAPMLLTLVELFPAF